MQPSKTIVASNSKTVAAASFTAAKQGLSLKKKKVAAGACCPPIMDVDDPWNNGYIGRPVACTCMRSCTYTTRALYSSVNGCECGCGWTTDLPESPLLDDV